jgi:hypothetical protein
MKDILEYERRDQLYQFLITDFGFVKSEEQYDPNTFGNFFITLSSKEFLVRYVNDRSYMTIKIAGYSEPSRWYDLSFVRGFVYDQGNINSDDQLDNSSRIEELNNFLKMNFDLISDLFDKDNYSNTCQKIEELLRRQFGQRFPGMIQ